MTERSPEFDRLLAENQRYAATFDRSALTAAPQSRIVILACMDARLDVHEVLGLRTGDAHVIRNAGGIVTDDVIRSLLVSMELLGTREIVVIEHTGCGLHGVDEQGLRDRVASRTSRSADAIDIDFGGFSDLGDNVRAQVQLLAEHPLLPRVPVHGLIFDVATGRLDEVR